MLIFLYCRWKNLVIIQANQVSYHICIKAAQFVVKILLWNFNTKEIFISNNIVFPETYLKKEICYFKWFYFVHYFELIYPKNIQHLMVLCFRHFVLNEILLNIIFQTKFKHIHIESQIFLNFCEFSYSL